MKDKKCKLTVNVTFLKLKKRWEERVYDCMALELENGQRPSMDFYNTSPFSGD